MSFGYRVLDALANASVFLAYGAPGYRIRSHLWDAGDLDVDLGGKVVVVTGASTGLGLAAARALAAQGATLEMISRDPARAEAAKSSVLEAAPGADVRLRTADLSSLADVRRLAKGLLASHARVDVLVNNAGVMLETKTLTSEGLETAFATNVLAGFLLTKLLLPALRRARPARVVHVTSGGMYSQRLDLEKLQGHVDPYDGVVAYAQTKRAQVVLNGLWAEHLRGTGVTSNAMHPGWADTPGVQSSLPRFRAVMKGLLRDPGQGADTIVWLACAKRLEETSGELFFDRRPRSTELIPGTKTRDEDARALWALSERLTSEP